MLNQILELISILLLGIMAGSTFYSSFVEIPIRTTISEERQLENWKLVFPKASKILKTLGIITVIILLITWYITDNPYWILAAIPVFMLLPFTAIAIAKTNKELLDLTDWKKAGKLISKWDRLHHIRTFLTILSFIIGIITFIYK